MKRILTGLALLLAFGATGAAQAAGTFTGRAGVTAGSYTFEDRFTDLGCCGGFSDESDDDDTTYGLLAGTTLGVGRFFADVGIEYSAYAGGDDLDGDGEEDDSYRTDGLLTLGAYVGDRWVLFAGYRNATFGDGFFSDEGGNTEVGPFFGGGVSFRPGRRISLGASLAYNLLTLEVQGTPIDDLDLTGLSAKFQLNVLETPHSVYLRYQRFTGDLEEANSFAYEYTENYLNVGYQLTFDFASW